MTDFQNVTTPINNFKNSAYESIQNTATDAEAEKAQKETAYKKAMAQLNIFKEEKSKAYSYLQSIKARSQNGDNNSELQTARAQYDSACNSYTEADNNADILMSSYRDSIFYAGKMNTSACLAKFQIS